MAAAMIDLMGRRFGRLTVTGRDAPSRRTRWICRCDCGETRSVLSANLRRGLATSCGCYREELRHSPKRPGLYVRDHLPEYMAWRNAKHRCYEEGNRYYEIYGGRGIAMCDAWRNDFEQFLRDMGKRPSRTHSLDRIDNNGPYSASNCRWATKTEQCLNRRSTRWLVICGERVSVAAAAERFGVKKSTIYTRLRAGWTDQEAVSVDGRK